MLNKFGFFLELNVNMHVLIHLSKKKKMHVLIQPLVYIGRSAKYGQDPLGATDNVRQAGQGGTPNLLCMISV